MKTLFISRIIACITLSGYFFICVLSSAIAAPIKSKINTSRERFLQQIEKNLMENGLSRQEVCKRFQGLTNKDIMTLYNHIQAIKFAGSEERHESLKILGTLLGISVIILLLCLSAKNNEDDGSFEKALEKYKKN